MKILKKAASLALSAVLTVSMLTACGGSSGNSAASAFANSNMAKLSKKLANGYTMEYTATVGAESAGEEDVAFTTECLTVSDGQKTYSKTSVWGFEFITLSDGEYSYSINTDDGTYTKEKTEEVSTDDITNYYDTLKNSVVSFDTGKTTVDGVEYDSETIVATVSGMKYTFVYCYKGDTPVYYSVDTGNDAARMTVKITSFKPTYEPSYLDFDAILSNYTED